MPELRERIRRYDGPIFSVVSDQIELEGEVWPRDIVQHPGSVGILPISGNKVRLVKQYRHPVGQRLLEIPAGTLPFKDSDPLIEAQRELREETGCMAAVWEPLGDFYPSPGFLDEKVTLFLATGLERVTNDSRVDVVADPGEFLEIVSLPVDEAIEYVHDAKTLIALMAYKIRREAGVKIGVKE